MAEPLGVILAGGQSRRMGGGDKCLTEIAGRSLLKRVIERLGPQVAGLALNANGDPGRFAAFGLPVLADPVPGFPGLLAGVLAGLDWAAARGARELVSVAADTPFLPAGLVLGLHVAAHVGGAALAYAETPDGAGGFRPHPVFALWPVGCREALRAALAAGRHKVIAFLEAQGAARAVFESHPFDPFFNVNTPDDKAEAERLAAEFGL